VTGHFPLGFLTVQSVPEDPPILLSSILSLEIYLVRGSNHAVARYTVFFRLSVLPPSQAQYIFLHPILSSKASVFFSVRHEVSHIRNSRKIIVLFIINYVLYNKRENVRVWTYDDRHSLN
jgi:hypothetical protein